ncbi:MAG: choline dehydrogenase [bacterium]|nr:MAG: choline dehydrogenase [bacterium]
MGKQNVYDYIIIGAGSAGCVLANRLTQDPSVNVLLLEAGGADEQMEIHVPLAFSKLFLGNCDWAYYTVPQSQVNNRQLYWPRGKVLGGSSSLNAMIYIRGNKQDYDNWQALGNPGWSYEEVLPYFKKAQNQERGASTYHGIDGLLNVSDLRCVNPLTQAFVNATSELNLPQNNDFNGETQEGFGFYQVTQKNGKRCSAALAYLHPVLFRTNLTVKTHAQVSKLLLSNKRVAGVAFTQNNKQEIAKADREVILSGGAVNSPQLLMLSGIGSADELKHLGIDVVVDLPGVGKNLQDHLFMAVCYDSLKPISLSTAETEENMASFVQAGQGPLTSNVGEAGGFTKTDSSLTVPNIQFHFAPLYYINHGFTPPEGHGFTIGPTLLKPKSLGYLKLNPLNIYQAPLIDPCYLTEPQDLKVLIAGVKLAQEIAQTKAFQPYCGSFYGTKLNNDSDIVQYIRNTIETLYHPTGTCKMGTDLMAVVDSNLRVHGIENLRVIDGSIIPEITSGNTNAPIIMIAEKAADFIIDNN